MNTATINDARVEAMLAKQSIHEVLARYCHGIDRCDIDMLKSAYWPDATDTHGTFNGNAWEFAEFIVSSICCEVCSLLATLISISIRTAPARAWKPMSLLTCKSRKVVSARIFWSVVATWIASSDEGTNGVFSTECMCSIGIGTIHRPTSGKKAYINH